MNLRRPTPLRNTLLLRGRRTSPPDVTAVAAIHKRSDLLLWIPHENAPGPRLARLKENIRKYWTKVLRRLSLLLKEQLAILAADSLVSRI
jgi:hypothetical protein